MGGVFDVSDGGAILRQYLLWFFGGHETGIGLTLGQQSWLRLLNIEHHQVLAGTTASMAPGFEDAQALKAAKAAAHYWAPQTRADTP